MVYCTSHFGAALAVSRLVLNRLGFGGLQSRLEAAAARYSDWWARAFDARYGTDTFQRIDLADLGLGGNDESFRRWQYGPINPDFFREIMRAAPPDRSRMTFLDVGSGKGLALLLATKYGFRRVVGVELSSELNEIASNNIGAYSRATGRPVAVDLICADFIKLPLPLEPTFYFLNNPFPEHVGHHAVTHLEESLAAHPREAWALWRRCTFPIIERLDNSPLLDLAVATPYWRLYRTKPGIPTRGG